jgi:hypothetical protein
MPLFLAWDIGIKNLAYNIIDYQHDNKDDPYRIKEWDVINLVEDEQTLPDNAVTFIQCCMMNKKGKNCTQKAKFINSADKSIGYCGKHEKEILSKDEINLTQVKSKMKCTHLNSKGSDMCSKNGIWLNMNNPYIRYCNIHHKSVCKKNIDEEIIEDYYMDTKHAAKVKGFNMNALSLRLFEILDKKPELLEVDEVMIENQPVLKNPTMKSIQMLVYSYFVIRGIMKKKISKISFFMAGKKLEAFTGNHDIADKFSHIKSKYTQTKNTAVLFCKEMIKEHQSDWHDYICQHHKQDDLADTFMMNCRYIQRHHISQIENLEKQKIKDDIKMEKELKLKDKKVNKSNQNKLKKNIMVEL